MSHLNSLEDAKLDRDSLVTIGVFDGVHIGHQSLLNDLVERADKQARNSIVVTFHPHPDKVLGDVGERYYLTTPTERAELILALGVDLVITLPFDERIRHLTAERFVTQLVSHLRVRELWVGADFALGFKREGNVRFLRAQGKRHGFAVMAVELITARNSGRLVRSSKVRDFVRCGDVKNAKSMLGRSYALAGQVVEGEQRGRAINFPTANIDAWPEQLIPANGVYATWAELGEDVYMAATNIGNRPTFAGEDVTIEAHLLDFEGDIYGCNLVLRFEERLRAEQKFGSLDELVSQIKADIAATRRCLGAQSMI